jgi:hypothetical protein
MAPPNPKLTRKQLLQAAGAIALSGVATRTMAQRAYVPTRILASVRVPDTPLINAAIALARDACEPVLFNHCMRSWLFSAKIAQDRGIDHDPEVLAVAMILHDIGLAEKFVGPHRFEVDSANAARNFVQQNGSHFTPQQIQLVWDAVALNTTRSIAMHKEAEVSLTNAGVALDYGGLGKDKFPAETMSAILKEFPRHAMKQTFKNCFCHLAQTKPQTTYDTFIRDFGTAFVAGYKVPSSVEYLMTAPYDE